MDRIRQFLCDDSGSATVEWVVMTAASVGIGLAVMSVVSDGVESLSNDVHDALTSFTIMTSFEDWDAFRADADQAAASPDGSAQ